MYIYIYYISVAFYLSQIPNICYLLFAIEAPRDMFILLLHVYFIIMSGSGCRFCVSLPQGQLCICDFNELRATLLLHLF
jgi:hypothetical protein